MICPYCNGEMKKGYIQSRDGFGWNEKKRLISALSGAFSEVDLGKVVTAYRCLTCRKMVIDYSEV